MKQPGQVVVQRNGRIDGILLHQNPVGQAQSQGALAAALADDDGDDGVGHFQHGRQGVGDGVADALLFGFQPRVGALGVHQRNQRQLEPGGQGDDALRLAQSVGIDMVAFALHQQPPLLPDDRHRLALQIAHAGHHRTVVAADPVAAQFDERVQQSPEVGGGRGAFRVARRRHRVPGVDRLHRGQFGFGRRLAAVLARLLTLFVALHNLQQQRQPAALRLPVDHIVQQPMPHVRLGGMGVQRQRKAGGGFQRPQRRQADERLGFGHNHIGEVGETGVGLAGGGVGQQHQKGGLAAAHPVGRRDGLGHLHQRQHAFLHPHAAARHHRHHRLLPAGGVFQGGRHFFAHHAAHRAAHKGEIQHDEGHFHALDFAAPGHRRLGDAGAVLFLGEQLAEPAGAGKGEGGDGGEVLVGFAESAAVGQQLDAFPGGDGVVKAAERADPVGQVGRRVDDEFFAVEAAFIQRRQPRRFGSDVAPEQVHQKIGQVPHALPSPSIAIILNAGGESNPAAANSPVIGGRFPAGRRRPAPRGKIRRRPASAPNRPPPAIRRADYGRFALRKSYTPAGISAPIVSPAPSSGQISANPNSTRPSFISRISP